MKTRLPGGTGGTDTRWSGENKRFPPGLPPAGLLVGVEVKARATDRFGSPALAVAERKQRRLRRLAAQWLVEHPEHRRNDIRFDVVAVTGARVEVFIAAF